MESTKIEFLSWEEVRDKASLGEDLNPIDKFIYELEPRNFQGSHFRHLLKNAINFEDEESRTTRNVEIVGMFIEHCEGEGFIIPEELFNSFFNV